MKNKITTFFLIGSLALAAVSAVATAIVKVNPEDCTNCGLCIEVCPTEAISTQEIDGKVVAVINPDECTNCGLCIETCPTEAISEVPIEKVETTVEETKEAE